MCYWECSIIWRSFYIILMTWLSFRCRYFVSYRKISRGCEMVSWDFSYSSWATLSFLSFKIRRKNKSIRNNETLAKLLMKLCQLTLGNIKFCESIWWNPDKCEIVKNLLLGCSLSSISNSECWYVRLRELSTSF